MRNVLKPLTTGLLLASVLAGCDADHPAEPTPVPGPVVSVEVTARDGVFTGSVKVGQTIELKATARASDGRDLPAASAVWSSSDTTVAVVNGAGLVTARRAGAVMIRALVASRTGQIGILIIENPPAQDSVARVTLSPAAGVLVVGQSRQYTARAYSANGTELHGRAVTWRATAPGIISVSAQGLVTALANGYADVIATIDGVSAGVGLTVILAEPDPQPAMLRTVGNQPLPVVLRTFKVTDEYGIERNRTIRATGGRIAVDLYRGRYEQQVTLELWEDIYWIINGQSVFCCVQLKETKVFEDRGTVAPVYSGSGTLVFVSEVIASHTFSGFGTGAGYDLTQRVANAGDPVQLRFW